MESVALEKPPPTSPPSSPPTDTTSSPLSELSKSPSPPPAPSTREVVVRYPTPPNSQESGRSSPMLKRIYSSDDSIRLDPDGSPPAKRRKGPRGTPIPRAPKQPKERTTQRLNLSEASTGSNKEQEHMLDRLIYALRYKKKIVIVAGAGISVSAGIPDFRSKSGLFASRGKHLFDSSVYKHADSTRDFHDMVRNLFELIQKAQPTSFHHMIASIATEGRLLRLYTQNVDGLETAMKPLATTIPLKKKVPKDPKDPWPKTVQLHGTLRVMHCTKCNYSAKLDPCLFEGAQTPDCPSCTEDDNVRTGIAGKRSHGIGRLRPRMLLYQETGPDDNAIGEISTADIRSRPDAVIVVGTSLKVPGIKRIVREMCHTTRCRRNGITAWINLDPQGPQGVDMKDCFDLIVEGKSDDVASLVNLPCWDDPNDIIEVADLPEDIRKSEERKLSFDRVEVQLLSKKLKRSNKAVTRVKKEEGTVTPGDSPVPKPAVLLKQKGLQKKQATLAFNGKTAEAERKTPAKPSKPKAPRKPRQPKGAKQPKHPKNSIKQVFKETKGMAPAGGKPGKAIISQPVNGSSLSSLPPLRPSRPSLPPSTPTFSLEANNDASQGVDTSFHPSTCSDGASHGGYQRNLSTETISPKIVPRGMEGLLD